jgi:two-component system sensor histidine kinase KdpD
MLGGLRDALLTVFLADLPAARAHGREEKQDRVAQFVAPALLSLVAVLVTTLILLLISSYLEAEHLVLGYLVPTILIAVYCGSAFAVFTSFASGLAAAYFFFPPKLSFYIADPRHVAELGFFLLLAAIASKAVSAITRRRS